MEALAPPPFATVADRGGAGNRRPRAHYAGFCRSEQPERSNAAQTEPDCPEFEDLSESSVRDKPWVLHKLESERVAEVYRDMTGPGFAQWSPRMDDCAQALEFARVLAPEEGAGVLKKKLVSARFCRVRMCPTCSWRRSLRWRGRMFEALPQIEEAHTGGEGAPRVRWVFLTLTVKNVAVEDLNATFKHLHQSFRRMAQRTAWPALGWIRCSEVTRSKTGEAHPHIHTLMMVPESYFVGPKYLSKDQWIELWRSCARLDYDPSVDVRVVEPKEGAGDAAAAVRSGVVECLKYGVKPGDLVKDKTWAHELARQLHGVRQVGIGGELREFLREEEPTEEEMLVGIEGEEGGEAEEEDLGTEVYIFRGDPQRSPRYVRRVYSAAWGILPAPAARACPSGSRGARPPPG